MPVHVPMSARRGALSIVEAVISLVLVSGVMVAALNTVGASFSAQRNVGDRIRGQLLANDLMAEILALSYEDPNETVAYGLELSESGGVGRAKFDDVDDYRNITDSPPSLKDGTPLTGLPSGWSRSVAVARVESGNLEALSMNETGVKRITVTVRNAKSVVATLTGIKTKASPPAGSARQPIKEILKNPVLIE